MNKVKNVLMVAGTLIAAAKAIADVVEKMNNEIKSLPSGPVLDGDLDSDTKPHA